MATTFNSRITDRYLWTGLVISTIIGCTAFVYIILQLGNSYDSGISKHFSNNPEGLTDEVCMPICNSKECLFQSKYLLSYIDPKADPCENYFEFACGEFLGKSVRNETRMFLHDQVFEMTLILKRILDDIKPDYESASGKLRVVYESCLKESSSDRQAIPSLLEFLHTAGIPNWPHLDRDFQFNENKLKSALGKLLTYEEFGFMDVERGVEEADSKVKALLCVSESIYNKKEKSIRKYLIERILKYFNLESTAINEIWEESENINEAITLLQEESEKKDQKEGVSIICGTNAEARWEFACGVVESFIDTAGVNSSISKQFVTIDRSSIYFVENIFYVLKNFSDRSIANYLAFNIFFNHMENLNFYFHDALRRDPKYSISYYFPKERNMTPWQRCIDWLIKKMYLPLAYEFVREFKMEEIKEVSTLIQKNMEETADVVSTQDWMLEDMRVLLAKVVRHIGYDLDSIVSQIMNETNINAFYKEFQPSNASFLYNDFEYNRFFKYENSLHRNKLVRFLKKGLDKSLLISGAFGGGGYLSVTLGTLLPPIYRPGLDRSLNLLSLAAIIAHEIGHSFDFFTKSDFFTSADPAGADHMNNTFLCLANQFSKFKYGIIEKHINGSQYGRENFGDNVAIKIIDSFIEKYSSSDDASLLPGLPYTMEQTSYLSALEIWCESTSEEAELLNTKDSHSLGKFRMLGMVQNSKVFAKAFNCPEGSYMNPATKCLVFN